MHRDDDCESSNESTNGGRSANANSKTKQIKDIVIEDGAGGGGGGATFIYLLNSAEVAIPLLVAAGGGGLGYGHAMEDKSQHGKIYDSTRVEVSGQRHGEANYTGGAGNKQNLCISTANSCDVVHFPIAEMLAIYFHEMSKTINRRRKSFIFNLFDVFILINFRRWMECTQR